MENEVITIVSGAGKGIAQALGAKEATVHITGRTTDPATSAFGGSVFETAEQVRALFARITKDHGRFDILVNDAAALPSSEDLHHPFWEKSFKWAELITLGLRAQKAGAEPGEKLGVRAIMGCPPALPPSLLA